MKDGLSKCRYCGKMIAIITWGVYRKAVVDPEAIAVVPEKDGEEFVRIDGSKILGREAEPGTIQPEYAYRPHGKNCRRRKPS